MALLVTTIQLNLSPFLKLLTQTVRRDFYENIVRATGKRNKSYCPKMIRATDKTCEGYLFSLSAQKGYFLFRYKRV